MTDNSAPTEGRPAYHAPGIRSLGSMEELTQSGGYSYTPDGPGTYCASSTKLS